LLTQLALAASIIFLALARPDINSWMTALAAVLVAFFSASQDIVIDAYRVERLTPETQGQGAAMAQCGYQFGIIAAGAGALHLAKHNGWQQTYFFMAMLVGIGIIATLLCKEPEAPLDAPSKARNFLTWIHTSVIAPFADFMRHPDWFIILLFIVVYKFADAFLGRMTSPFFHDMHFDKDDIATIVKFYGTIATLLGVFIGGILTRRFGSLRILFLVGLLHAFTNLLYVEQARLGANTNFLAFSMAIENFTGGISSAAFVAYLSNLCNVHYTATQYALLSSLAAFGRTWLATPAGWFAEKLGWEGFFAVSSLLALPGLILLIVLNRRLTLRPIQDTAP
jgi:PAT family beta-lactamase induction signal transducer AmpG